MITRVYYTCKPRFQLVIMPSKLIQAWTYRYKRLSTNKKEKKTRIVVVVVVFVVVVVDVVVVDVAFSGSHSDKFLKMCQDDELPIFMFPSLPQQQNFIKGL